MLIKIDLLTLISEKELVTAYFIDKNTKIILSQNFLDQKSSGEADLKLFRRLVDILEAEILYVELGNAETETRLHLLTKDKNLEKIELPLKTAVSFAGFYGCPIFVQHELLYKEGIMVTKELIEDTLQY